MLATGAEVSRGQQWRIVGRIPCFGVHLGCSVMPVEDAWLSAVSYFEHSADSGVVAYRRSGAGLAYRARREGMPSTWLGSRLGLMRGTSIRAWKILRR